MGTYRDVNEDPHTWDKLLLVQSETREEVEIPRLEPEEAYRTLEAWIATNKSQCKQLKVLAEKVSL